MALSMMQSPLHASTVNPTHIKDDSGRWFKVEGCWEESLNYMHRLPDVCSSPHQKATERMTQQHHTQRQKSVSMAYGEP